MTRTMYDSVTVGDIPPTPELVAGYVDGHYANVVAMKKRFPHVPLVQIAVFASTDGGIVLDVERGNATPIESVGWVLKRRKAGVNPSVYCSASDWPIVRNTFHNAHVPEPHYWIAHYDNIATIPAGAIAKQYRNTPGYDVSIVADYWPGFDAAPRTAIPPFPGVLQPGISSPAVTLLDNHLIKIGYRKYYSSGPGPFFGKSTSNAVKAFKKLHTALLINGVATDIVGPATWKTVFEAKSL